MTVTALFVATTLAAAYNKEPKSSGDSYMTHCPCHQDDNGSLSVKEENGKLLVNCHAGCTDQDTLFKTVRKLCRMQKQIDKVYEYRDGAGIVLFEKVRYSPKSFVQRRSDGAGGYIWKLDGIDKSIPYRLPEARQAIENGQPVWIAEGEKDCDNLASIGLPAVCNFGGASKDGKKPKWTNANTVHLEGLRQAFILPDNDDAGSAHARAVARSLSEAGIQCKIVELPNLPPKGDVSDWLQTGGTREQLLSLAIDSPSWTESDSPVKTNSVKLDRSAAIAVEHSEQAIREISLPTEFDPPFLSEDHIATRFTEQHGAHWRFVAKSNEWFHWIGCKWQKDDKLLAFSLVRNLCRAAAKEAPTDERQKLTKAATIASVERLARSDQRTAASIEDWDQHPWLLNTPDGIVDLRTGQINPHRADLYLTKITSVSPANIPTPIWDEFLKSVQPSYEMRVYLYRRSGYQLTGITREQALFFDFGTGANGKSVFQKVMLELLGTYATTAAIDLLTENQTEKHPEEIARLNGVRIVALSETQSGRRWNEARIKALTGEDRLSGRFMRQNTFEFQPIFKLSVLGNHMPSLRNVDEAIGRRLQIVHWSVTIPAEKRDKDLFEKMRPELPGILFKMVRGCIKWARGGLNPPSSVRSATNEYLDSEDTLGLWLSECEKDKARFSTNDELYSSWCLWGEKQGERFPGNKTKFTQDLEKRGFKRSTQNNKRGFLGLVGPAVAQRIHADQSGLQQESQPEEDKGTTETWRP